MFRRLSAEGLLRHIQNDSIGLLLKMSTASGLSQLTGLTCWALIAALFAARAEAACGGTLLADSTVSGTSQTSGYNSCSNPWNGVSRGYYVASSSTSTPSQGAMSLLSLNIQTGSTFSFPSRPIYNWIPPTTTSDFGGFFSDGNSQRLMFGVKEAIPFNCVFNCGPETWGFPVLRWQVRAGQTARCYEITVTAGTQGGCTILGIASNGIKVQVGSRIRSQYAGTAPWTWSGWSDVSPGGSSYTTEVSTQDKIEQVEVR